MFKGEWTAIKTEVIFVKPGFLSLPARGPHYAASVNVQRD